MAVLDDERRLRALAETGLIGAERDEAFDRLTRVTTALLDVPISLVTFIEPERQFFVSCVGLPEPWQTTRETPLSHSFCQHCVVAGTPFVVDDARLHPLVRDNKAVEDLGVVAYAGVPIMTSDGSVVGTLCAIDSKPRAWKPEEISLLSDLAAAAMTELERRTLVRELAKHGLTPREASEEGLNIEAAARRTGVPAATLRKWEQRYGVPTPARTGGHHRRYTEADVARINWLKARLAEGYRIGVAASRLASHSESRVPEPVVEALVTAAARGDERALREKLDQALAEWPAEDVAEEILAPALTRLASA